MPDIERPDGATIHYEVFGTGHPLLLFAPGGVNSEIGFWERSAINAIELFKDDFMVIGMDQRHAGKSLAPASAFSYDDTVADQLAVLDDLGVKQAHVMGGCIGCAYALRIIHDAPERISAAVLQDPVGLDGTNSMDVFYDMFRETMRLARDEGVGAVVDSAMDNPVFVMNNGAGPFARRIHADEAFREEIRNMRTSVYISLIVRFRDGIWPSGSPLFTVSEEWLKGCPAPLLVLPGSDQFHPTAIGQQICADAPHARCLDVDARSETKLTGTIEQVRQFLVEHAP